jgi:hypothetical protein
MHRVGRSIRWQRLEHSWNAPFFDVVSPARCQHWSSHYGGITPMNWNMRCAVHDPRSRHHCVVELQTTPGRRWLERAVEMFDDHSCGAGS